MVCPFLCCPFFCPESVRECRACGCAFVGGCLYAVCLRLFNRASPSHACSCAGDTRTHSRYAPHRSAAGPEGVGGVPEPMGGMGMGGPRQHGGGGMVAQVPYTPMPNMPYGVPPPPPGRPPAPPPPGAMVAAPAPMAAYPSMNPSFHGTRPDRLPPPPPGRPPMKK